MDVAFHENTSICKKVLNLDNDDVHYFNQCKLSRTTTPRGFFLKIDTICFELSHSVKSSLESLSTM